MTTNKPETRAFLMQQDGYEPYVSIGRDSNCSGVIHPLIRLSDYEALQAECDQLRKDAEARHEGIRLLNYLFARNIIAMQSAVIEWEKGKGAAAGMQWIWNTLFGPGQIPDEEETDAQAYFDREIEPLDAALQEDSQ